MSKPKLSIGNTKKRPLYENEEFLVCKISGTVLTIRHIHYDPNGDCFWYGSVKSKYSGIHEANLRKLTKLERALK